MRFAFLLVASSSFASAQVPGTACGPRLIFASDTQEPMLVERLYLHGNDNRHATEALLEDMLAQDPTDLFLLGDVVNLGCGKKRWTRIDSVLTTARSRGFRVHAILGNHELMGRAAAGERNFQERFPAHVRTGYAVRNGGVLVILLNSNFSKLSKADLATQLEWYHRTLAEADTAADVEAIIVCCHHSPYSTSTLVGSNDDVQRLFVDPFMKTCRTVAFISGHAHLFQHFRDQEKHFFVIGGGGGLHHPLMKDPGPAVCLEPDYDPLFHYLTLERCGPELHLVSRRLKDDRTAFDEGCDFTIELPAGSRKSSSDMIR